MMLSDIELYPNKTNRAKLVKNLLESLGFGGAWLYQSIGNTDFFLLEVRQGLNDKKFIQNWNARLANSSRAIFYRSISDNFFEFKNYFECVNISKYRYALTRLKVSSHRLEVEAGR